VEPPPQPTRDIVHLYETMFWSDRLLLLALMLVAVYPQLTTHFTCSKAMFDTRDYHTSRRAIFSPLPCRNTNFRPGVDIGCYQSVSKLFSCPCLILWACPCWI